MQSRADNATMTTVKAQSPDTLLWEAPTPRHPVTATVTIPGSKSMTNRALILAALASGPSTITGALRSRDTDLMIAALRAMGATIEESDSSSGSSSGSSSTDNNCRRTPPASISLRVTPTPQLHGATVDCGLAGTVMRFLPPVAALADGPVLIDGDPHARKRPLRTMADALRQLGVTVEGDSLPLRIEGVASSDAHTSTGNPHASHVGTIEGPRGGAIRIDASSSSQFISGLLLSAARFTHGITVTHTGTTLPSQPHIEMTIDMLRDAGIGVTMPEPHTWQVAPGDIQPNRWVIEPDLSNATPFMAAAAVTGGRVVIPNWPTKTTQPGDQFRTILEEMGAHCDLVDHDLVVTGPDAPADGRRSGPGLTGITMDLHDIGELTPTIAALAALADTPSHLYGIAHLRGHETDRLHALATNINALGGQVEETDDGLIITPAPLHGNTWPTYDDHRMATAGAVIGLAVAGVRVENIGTTSKTFPDFARTWLTATNSAEGGPE